MLKPALLYEEDIQEEEIELWHNERYMYYDGFTGHRKIEIGDNCYDRHDFASVNKDDVLLGYISYNISYTNLSVDNFGVISYDLGNLEFARDIITAVKNIFWKYHMNRIEFFCFVDNPSIRSYRKLVKLCGGRECGYYRQVGRLQDGLMHDAAMFEILAEDIKKSRIFERIRTYEGCRCKL